MVSIAQAKSGSILYIWIRKAPPKKKFWSNTTIFSLEKLIFSHFLGHENLIWGNIMNRTTYVWYFDGDWKFWSHTTIILKGPTSFFHWFYNFLVMKTLLEVRSWIAQPTLHTSLFWIWKSSSKVNKFVHPPSFIFGLALLQVLT